MVFKRFSLHLGLSLAVGFSLLLVNTKAHAQVGNASDITGPIPTTSDIINGAFIPNGGGASGRISFRNSDAVNRAADSINSQLANSSLGSVLAGSGNVSTNASQLITTLSNASGGSNPALVRNLLASLQGLTSNGTVNAGELRAAIAAYNALINGSGGEFLNRRPDELLTIRAVLEALVNASGT